MQPGSLKSITDSKLITFAVGQQKKSRFQKAREEKELKKKLDEEAAARDYDSFVASFQDDESTSGKTFIRGGQMKEDDKSFGGKRGEVYKLDRSNSITSETRSSYPHADKEPSEMDKLLLEMKVSQVK